jgi:hypothetical protein
MKEKVDTALTSIWFASALSVAVGAIAWIWTSDAIWIKIMATGGIVCAVATVAIKIAIAEEESR